MAERELDASIATFAALRPQLDALRGRVQEHLKLIQQMLINKRAAYEKALSTLNEQQRELQRQIQQCADIEEQLEAEVSEEAKDRDNSSMKVREMKQQEAELLKQKQRYQAQIEKVDGEIEQRMHELQAEKESMGNQRTLLDERALQYEEVLGMRVETGNVGNQIRFVFKEIDPDDFSREVNFVLDPDRYEVVETEPQLDSHTTQQIMGEFKRHKQIGYLWRDMRKALKERLRE